MKDSLARQYNFPRLLLFAFPNIIMMIFLSIYTIVDGIFISRYIGTTALSAVNMVYPVFTLEMAVGFMLATGGSAVIAIRLGEKKEQKARENFSLVILSEFIIGVVIAIVGNLFLEQLVWLLGTNEAQFPYCMEYGRMMILFAPFLFLQTAFQTLFITAGKPTLGLAATVLGGVANMVLDYLFMGVLSTGIVGAAVATGIGYMIPAIIGLVYFGFCRKGSLYFVKPKWDGKMMLKSITNGTSEMLTHLSEGISTFLFNWNFMRYYGEDGVAAITIVLYFQFVLVAIFFGYSMGVAPVIGYKYGAKDKKQLKKIHRSSLGFVGVCSVISYILSEILIGPVTSVFTQTGSNVYQITLSGFWMFAISFLFMGISIYASSLFTALSDGMTSAVISFARTILFLIAALVFLPMIFGTEGVWFALPVAEFLGVLVAAVMLLKNRKKYGY